jgi:hypothetical protein
MNASGLNAAWCTHKELVKMMGSLKPSWYSARNGAEKGISPNRVPTRELVEHQLSLRTCLDNQPARDNNVK